LWRFIETYQLGTREFLASFHGYWASHLIIWWWLNSKSISQKSGFCDVCVCVCVWVCFLEKGNNHCHPSGTVPSASSSNAGCKGRKWNIATCYRQNRARHVVRERQRYFIFAIERAIICSCEDAHSSIVTVADNLRRLRSSSHNSERSPNLLGTFQNIYCSSLHSGFRSQSKSSHPVSTNAISITLLNLNSGL
jgi:hypothetical protein